MRYPWRRVAQEEPIGGALRVDLGLTTLEHGDGKETLQVVAQKGGTAAWACGAKHGENEVVVGACSAASAG